MADAALWTLETRSQPEAEAGRWRSSRHSAREDGASRLNGYVGAKLSGTLNVWFRDLAMGLSRPGRVECWVIDRRLLVHFSRLRPPDPSVHAMMRDMRTFI